MKIRWLFQVLALAASLSLAAPGPVRACEKDAECKPPRVCQNRECVSPGESAPKGAAGEHRTAQSHAKSKKHHAKHEAAPTPAPAQ